ncbi:ATP-binding protein [Streptomyces sp. MB09-02B]|uniref:ATP-binding protein n=1 Tax=Streptomyces sp. MB09-02B TaxID=3028667 RepID=UPI0029A44E40|nr:tetratricopeptide repeat protein [Streptomyces sp. MB09-02B]MDX3639699.1 tetratricopeptide repeat protein [Streptomyces sp. MB09-02B]
MGRRDDLARLAQAGSCVLHGTAGVGKTALALHFGHEEAERFPDGQLYADLRGFAPGPPAAATEVLRGFLLALGVPEASIPPEESAMAATYRSAIAGRRLFILLDNVRNSAHARPLLPADGAGVVVITSRHRLDSLAAREGLPHIGLDLLSSADASALLTRRIGAEHTAAEPDAVTALVHACARLPLALCLVAARTAGEPGTQIAHIERELRDERSRLDNLALDETDTDLRAVFSWSVRALSSSAARLFRLTAVHRGPDLTLAAAASLLGAEESATRPLLRRLVSGALLEEHAPGRYRSHDLLRAYAAGLSAEERTEGEQARCRLFDHLLHTGLTANRRHARFRQGIDPGPPAAGTVIVSIADLAEANDWFRSERLNLIAAVTDAEQHGLDAYAWQLPWVLTTFLYRHGHWDDLTTVQTIAAAAAARVGDTPAQARAYRDLGRIAVRLGRYEDARDHHTEALRLCTESGDARGQAHSHYAVSLALERLAAYNDSLSHARRALELYETEGNDAWRAAGLNRLGSVLTMVGDHQAALAYCTEAYALLVALEDRYYQAHALASLGLIHHRTGSHDEAIGHYQACVGLWRDFGNRFEEATALHRLGDVRLSAGDRQAALQAWSRALQLLEELGHAEAETIRGKLSDVRLNDTC